MFGAPTDELHASSVGPQKVVEGLVDGLRPIVVYCIGMIKTTVLSLYHSLRQHEQPAHVSKGRASASGL